MWTFLGFALAGQSRAFNVSPLWITILESPEEAKTVTDNQPVYCRRCGQSGAWKRKPEGDVLTVSGRVVEMRFVCACGASVLVPPAKTAKPLLA